MLAGLFKFYRDSKGRAQNSAELRDEKIRKETQLLDLKISREHGEMMPVDDVESLVRYLSMTTKTLLYQRLGQELGPRAIGQTPAEINAVGNGVAAEICNIFKDTIKKWIREKNVSIKPGAAG